MSVRNCAELGISLQKIVMRLLENDDLINLLYYEDQDPLHQPYLSKEDKQKKIYGDLIKVVPKVGSPNDSKCRIIVYVDSGKKDPQNKEFKNIQIKISSFIPTTQWLIKDSNLRPFAILGQIQSSLDEKTINGLGKLTGGDFEVKKLTEEMSVYEQDFLLTEYD